MQNSHRKIIILILIITFTLIQFIVLYFFGYTPYPDSEGYLRLALENIRQDQMYPSLSQINNDGFIWNIGAINAIYFSLKFFGSVIPLHILYTIMKGFTVWFLYRIALKLTNQRIAFITLIIYILYPANYGESTSFLSEVPFIFFILCSLYLLLNNHILSSGITLAIANWFRPFSLIFLFVFCIYLLIYHHKKIIHIITGYAFILIIIGGINYYRTGYFIIQAKTGWMALTQYSWDHSSHKDNYQVNPSKINTFNCIEKDTFWKQQFFEWLKEHPTEYIQQMPEKIIKTYISDNTNLCTFIPEKNDKEYMYEEISLPTLIHQFPIYSSVQILTLYNLCYYYLLLIGFIIGCVFAYKERKNKLLLLSLGIVITGTLFIAFVGHGETRFHQPFMPFIILMTAFVGHQIYNKRQ